MGVVCLGRGSGQPSPAALHVLWKNGRLIYRVLDLLVKEHERRYRERMEIQATRLSRKPLGGTECGDYISLLGLP